MQPLVNFLNSNFKAVLPRHARVVPPTRQQSVLLPFDVTAALPRQADIFALTGPNSAAFCKWLNT